MTLRAEHVEPTEIEHLLAFDIGGGLVFGDEFLEAGPAFGSVGIETLSSRVAVGEAFRVATEEDVDTTARHVGGNRDRTETARLGDDVGLTMMLLGVEHLVRHALLFHHARKLLGLLDRHRADEHRLTGSVALDDVVDARLELGVLGLVDQVALVDPGNRLVGRDRHHVKAVGGHELRGFGLGGAGHAGESVVEAVVVLEGDGGERLVLFLDRYPFFCLHRLVKAVGPAATLHRPAGELVDDLHGAVAVDEIVPVPLVQLLGPDRGLELMDQVVRHLVVEVVDAECPLDRSHTLFERGDRALLLVDLVVDVATQASGDRGELHVQLGCVGNLAGDDQRGAGFVDED